MRSHSAAHHSHITRPAMKILSKCSSELSVREGQDPRQEHKTWRQSETQVPPVVIINNKRVELSDKVLLGEGSCS